MEHLLSITDTLVFRLMPKLTHVEHKAFKMTKTIYDERDAIEASALNQLLDVICVTLSFYFVKSSAIFVLPFYPSVGLTS